MITRAFLKWYLLVLFTFVAMPCAPSMAQLRNDDPQLEAEAESQQKPVDDETLLRENALHVEFMVSVLRKTFEKVKLSDQQREKIYEAIDTEVPQVVVKSLRQRDAFNDEQHQLYREEFAKARRGGFAPKYAHGFAIRNLRIDDKVKRKFNLAKSEADIARERLNEKIASFLTEEQRKTLPMFGGADKLSIRGVKLKLPNMKTEEDSENVKTIIEAIKGISRFQADLEKREVVFNSGYAKRLSTAIKEIKELPTFKDFSSFQRIGKPGSDNWKPVDLEIEPATGKKKKTEAAGSEQSETGSTDRKADKKDESELESSQSNSAGI